MNVAGFPLLSLITFLPLIGGLIIMTIRGEEAVVASNARWAALWTSLIVFFVSLVLWVKFDPQEGGFQFVESVSWLPEYGVGYKMGVDGISVLFVLLSTALTPICILASWESIQTKVREFMLSFLILETMMVGMFCALDFVVFYMFFEAVLIPMYLIIGVWGHGNRVYAAFETSEGRHHQPGSLGRSPSNSHRRRDIHRHRRLRPTPRRSADERQEQPNLPHLLAQPARPRQLAGMEMHSDDLGRPRPSSAQPLPPASHNPHALRDFLSFRAQRGTISNPCHSKRSEESAFSVHLLHANHNHPRLNPAQPRSRQNREPAPIGPAPSL